MEELVIVGGGVAGLGCLNALLDRGVSPLLIEASTIGSPKMCGEFLAPPVVLKLKQWGIGPMQAIKQVQFFSATHCLQLPFSNDAGGYARHDAEMALAARAKKYGARMIEQSPIQNITPATKHAPYRLHLMSGEIIQAREVIFATGKFSQQARASTHIGFKTHISHVIQPETLLMFSVPGGYFGIVPVTPETSNLTCLIKRKTIEKAGSSQAYAGWALAQQGITIHQSSWTHPIIEGPAPGFGLKTIPNWPHAYWIGDAFASIHPAIGYGFAHSLNSALLAVDYYLKHDPIGYHKALKRQMRSHRIIGQCMHHLLHKPNLCSAIIPFLDSKPWISHQLLKILGY